ncbi:unnamed protein product [Symbiodinium necroappetens]|uniref:Uncharacterized protein n=1 Tax=Symbiodinium necroappetens TaxID=1628268 RepID=A0A813BD69_9DINO|nr:unnamed protein product [Symbiodinium necroappetens]
MRLAALRLRPAMVQEDLNKSLLSFLFFAFQVLPVDAQATYPSEFRMDWCVGDDCFDQSISCAHFQLRLHSYYAEGSRPPLREAFFLVTLPPVYQRELLLGCPGMMVLAHLLLAEVRLYTHDPSEAATLSARAQAMMELPEITAVHLENIKYAWPLQLAMQRIANTSLMLDGRRPMTVDIVLPRCGEDLSWLANGSLLQLLPARTRVFVYEKCGGDASFVEYLSMRLESHIQLIHTQLDDAVDPATGLAARRDECTAYLSHVVREYDNLGDMTLFLHGDPSDHTPFGLLNILLRGISLGTFAGLDFVHLGSPRLVATYNPCQNDIYERAFNHPLQGRLFTYCCSQFAVSKRRIQQRPLEEYAKMLQLVDGSVADVCERIGPSYEKYAGQRLSHCFFLEFMWHVVFGEPDELPLRADEPKLPLPLRLKDSDESLPSLWKSYMSPVVGGYATFQRQNFESWLHQVRTHTDLGRAVQKNFGDGLNF